MEGTSKGKGKRKGTCPPRGVPGRPKRLPGQFHPLEIRRKAVQLCLEEAFPVPQPVRLCSPAVSGLEAKYVLHVILKYFALK